MAALTRCLSEARSILRRVPDQRGIETLEWCLIGALITAVAIAVYPGTLLPQLVAAANAIAALLTGP